MIQRATALLGASLLVVLATACGDDGGSNNGSCGDGHVTGSEQCDDGNTANGDGCSAQCQNESAGGVCGDMTVDVNKGETCDDGNTNPGDGCSSTCQTETPVNCGNGALNGTEACDDGNTMGGDGCSGTCTVEQGYTCTGMPSVCTMGGGMTGTCAAPTTVTFTGTGDLTATLTGDTTTGTSQVGDGACDGFGPEGGGNDKIFKFTTTDVRDIVIEIDTTVTMHGAIVRLLTAPCDLTTEIPEYTGAADGCADIEGSGFLGYVNRPAGTYYIVVDGFEAAQDGPFQINLKAKLPGCGNGTADPQLDFCDDGNTMPGDGCNANCEIEMGWNCRTMMGMPSVCQMIGCGDGIIQSAMNEVCDDDNTTPGDGCDATCQVESGWLCNTANPTVCVMAGCGNGIIESPTEECDDGNLMDGDRCSAACLLESDVAEAAEPNDTVPQALSAGSHIVRGEWMTGDVDLYTFTLTAPMKVEIETYFTINGVTTDYDGVGNNKFDCTTTDDTMLGVFAMGADVTMDMMALARDSDDGDSYCSYVGTKDSNDDDYEPNTTPDTMQLAMLPAGTYTIKVSGDTLPGSTMVTMPRRYMLDVKISMPGSTPVAPAAGDIVINEFLADDGPNANGDSNCDGVVTGTNDEFIELVNVSTKTLDLTGLTIKDGGAPQATPPLPPQLQFTFGAPTNVGPGSLTLEPGKAVVIWAGGAPACAGVTNWFTPVATQGTLSLNNAGDTITLATGGATPVTIATTTYATATQAVSFNLTPDAMSGTTYALHTALTGAVGGYSPGKKADGTAF
ncbi:MAG: DUF4215 domain-containing protein [Myxococcales bacterium]|nr:DUF4215 domain-containing protein [Myxococcales bacterium]